MRHIVQNDPSDLGGCDLFVQQVSRDQGNISKTASKYCRKVISG